MIRTFFGLSRSTGVERSAIRGSVLLFSFCARSRRDLVSGTRAHRNRPLVRTYPVAVSVATWLTASEIDDLRRLMRSPINTDPSLDAAWDSLMLTTTAGTLRM